MAVIRVQLRRGPRTDALQRYATALAARMAAVQSHVAHELSEQADYVRALRRRAALSQLGTIDLAARLSLRPILCGDCGPSEMTNDGACASCAGRAWVPAGRGALITFRDDAPGFVLVPCPLPAERMMIAPPRLPPLPEMELDEEPALSFALAS